MKHLIYFIFIIVFSCHRYYPTEDYEAGCTMGLLYQAAGVNTNGLPPLIADVNFVIASCYFWLDNKSKNEKMKNDPLYEIKHVKL